MAYIQKNNPFKQRVTDGFIEGSDGTDLDDVVLNKEYPEVLIEDKRKPKVDKEKLAKAGESISDYGGKIAEKGKEMYEGMKKYLNMYTR